jgi:hypothetical protein
MLVPRDIDQLETGSDCVGGGKWNCSLRPDSAFEGFARREKMTLVGNREMPSTHVTTKTVPFNRAPPSIAVPYLILIKCSNTRAVCGYLCDRCVLRSRSTSQFQLIVWRNVNHVSLHEMFWMNEHPAVGPFCVVVMRSGSRCARGGRWSRRRRRVRRSGRLRSQIRCRQGSQWSQPIFS